MADDFDFGESKNAKGTAKTGRRAQQKTANPPDAPDFEASVENSPKAPKSRQPAGRQEPDEPPKPSRVSGWGEDNPRKSRKLGEGFENFEDERLRPRTPEDDNESDTDIPVIPDLEEQQDDDMTVKVAIAPNVAVNRVATYRELDNDLLRQAAFTTLDNDIDLKLLTKNLSTEADLIEVRQAMGLG
ncbi:intraflagellar transport protein 43 [Mytilus galloprovincialis]|uniref:Intraflagellar transport protein 43 n=1 Tax=Mytilus galloprovincialis TaxID=29158 RepID=A0A8B6H319_MYTGA|nr:intraflagellar transport protein 43 [Mytilus galloprovincialis]